jgi:formate dehydrogenase subunit gamma
MSDHHEVTSIARAARGRTPGNADALLEILHEIQHRFGYVPEKAIPLIAEELNISRAEVHGVVTFYHDFRTSPPGRCVVKLCRAEACQAVGSEAVAAETEQRLGVRFGEASADGNVTLEPIYCLGNCALGPSALVDGQIYGRVTAERLASLVSDAVRKAANGKTNGAGH